MAVYDINSSGTSKKIISIYDVNSAGTSSKIGKAYDISDGGTSSLVYHSELVIYDASLSTNTARQCTTVTGGWSGFYPTSGGNQGNMTIQSNGAIRINSTTSSQNVSHYAAATINKLDLTPFNYIDFVITSVSLSSPARYGYTANRNSTAWAAFGVDFNTTGIQTRNISSLSGLYYVGFGAKANIGSSNSRTDVSKVILRV